MLNKKFFQWWKNSYVFLERSVTNIILCFYECVIKFYKERLIDNNLKINQNHENISLIVQKKCLKNHWFIAVY